MWWNRHPGARRPDTNFRRNRPMNRRSNPWPVLAGSALVATLVACGSMPGGSKSDMSFFVTSVGLGKGADLGGLSGADAHCQALATAAGAGGRTWHAYLSTQPTGSSTGGNARDRIGKGPWKNAKGVVVATDLDNLHDPAKNNINKQTALTEKGDIVNGRGDTPNTHDMLTGSQPSGVFIAGNVDSTCGNWTKSGPDGAAMMGHSDRTGLDDSVPAKSWNSSHQSRGGCGQAALVSTGGAGLYYCFATN
ncbi:MAG: hypothetical protein JSR59_06065 [Proteobacteria bacterium]|nr:hypothetical protein [Pseudomonadota bacterium]